MTSEIEFVLVLTALMAISGTSGFSKKVIGEPPVKIVLAATETILSELLVNI